jgi:hypothetical protein
LAISLYYIQVKVPHFDMPRERLDRTLLRNLRKTAFKRRRRCAFGVPPIVDADEVRVKELMPIVCEMITINPQNLLSVVAPSPPVPGRPALADITNTYIDDEEYNAGDESETAEEVERINLHHDDDLSAVEEEDTVPTRLADFVFALPGIRDVTTVTDSESAMDSDPEEPVLEAPHPDMEPEVAVEEEKSVLGQYCTELIATAIKTHVSVRAITSLLKVVEKFRSRLPVDIKVPLFVNMKATAMTRLPAVRMIVKIVDTDTHEVLPHLNVLALPIGDFPSPRYEIGSVLSYYELSDIVDQATALHVGRDECVFDPTRIVVSVDGVPERKSAVANGVSLKVMCVRFHGCSKIWPMSISRVTNPGLKPKVEELLQPLLSQLESLAIRLDYIVADAPERAFLRNQKTFAGYLSCDYCLIHGEKLKRSKKGDPTHPGNPRNESSGVYFPQGPLCEERTHEKTQLVMDYFDDWTSEAERCGYKGRSPLLDVPNFSIIDDLPAEVMHLAFTGLCKNLFNKSFDGSSWAIRQKIALGLDIRRVRVPKCFPRRARGEFTQYKSAEWRSMGILYFPLVVKLLSTRDADKDVTQLWLLFAYSLRAHLLEDERYQVTKATLRQSDISLQDINRSFGTIFANAFQAKSCTYNVHVWSEHLTRCRETRPLTACSAFPFEAMYGYIVSSLCAGTKSVGKQALGNLMLETQSRAHTMCHPNASYSTNETGVSQDNLVMRKDGRFFKLLSKKRSGIFLAEEIRTKPYLPPHCPDIVRHWHLVHVHVIDGAMQPAVTITLNLSDIETKAIIVGDTVMSIPYATLFES